MDGIPWLDLGDGTLDGNGIADGDWFQDDNENGIHDEGEEFDWYYDDEGRLWEHGDFSLQRCHQYYAGGTA